MRTYIIRVFLAHDYVSKYGRDYQQRLDRPSDSMVHVHHVHEVQHEVHDDGLPVIDVVATATVALDDHDELSSSATQLPSGGDEQQRADNEQSRPHSLLKYNVEEGLSESVVAKG